ncbi:hypothetical protein [Xenorhabdus hominickii]|uniref:Uncharacterized protein n=1 Tax=Xenorhabdus hominickii TaxID=351679 RepID=A0A2G0Q5U7_XENHO|nr:hypothetical protein [Xenorhabdus hominickii]AOM39632.1 hypothetical protein A9255_02905 [Xenorhabdus hominickii]PHM54584.1 hypothetical protein Xhom_02527 [Xenorhabdus hominickii]
MSKDVIDIASEIEKLQFKAAMELSNSWVMERFLLVNSVALYLLEKGDKEQAMNWMEGLLDWAEEDLLSEAENNASDLNGWVNKRMENEVSITKALEIFRAEMPDIEIIRKSWIESTEKLAEYENMEPVGFTNEVELEYVKNRQHGFIQVERFEKPLLPIPLYRHPNK